jgi:queuosine precursor transporter
MTTLLALLAYTFSMTLANLTIAAFGVWVAPINAFLLIGLDLTLRDWLHERLTRTQMAGLIAAASVLTWLLNADAGRIALASACAFGLAAVVDWVVFTRARGSWLRRANASNGASALVDSVVFLTMATGAFLPAAIAAQFAAKFAGGAAWAWLFARFAPRATA